MPLLLYLISVIQIFNDSAKKHRVTTSFQGGDVKLFDSHFSGRISSCVELQVAQMYGPLADSDGLLVSVVALQQQSPRTLNYGPLCIAAGYHPAKGDNLAEITFDESKLRQHLVNCFERERLSYSISTCSTKDNCVSS